MSKKRRSRSSSSLQAPSLAPPDQEDAGNAARAAVVEGMVGAHDAQLDVATTYLAKAANSWGQAMDNVPTDQVDPFGFLLGAGAAVDSARVASFLVQAAEGSVGGLTAEERIEPDWSRDLFDAELGDCADEVVGSTSAAANQTPFGEYLSDPIDPDASAFADWLSVRRDGLQPLLSTASHVLKYVNTLRAAPPGEPSDAVSQTLRWLKITLEEEYGYNWLYLAEVIEERGVPDWVRVEIGLDRLQGAAQYEAARMDEGTFWVEAGKIDLLAYAIRTSVDKHGTDESQLFAALANLHRLEIRMLEQTYKERFDTYLWADVNPDVEGEAQDEVDAWRSGDPVVGALAALENRVDDGHFDMEEVEAILRNIPESELARFTQEIRENPDNASLLDRLLEGEQTFDAGGITVPIPQSAPDNAAMEALLDGDRVGADIALLDGALTRDDSKAALAVVRRTDRSAMVAHSDQFHELLIGERLTLAANTEKGRWRSAKALMSGDRHQLTLALLDEKASKTEVLAHLKTLTAGERGDIISVFASARLTGKLWAIFGSDNAYQEAFDLIYTGEADPRTRLLAAAETMDISQVRAVLGTMSKADAGKAWTALEAHRPDLVAVMKEFGDGDDLFEMDLSLTYGGVTTDPEDVKAKVDARQDRADEGWFDLDFAEEMILGSHRGEDADRSYEQFEDLYEDGELKEEVDEEHLQRMYARHETVYGDYRASRALVVEALVTGGEILLAAALTVATAGTTSVWIARAIKAIPVVGSAAKQVLGGQDFVEGLESFAVDLLVDSVADELADFIYAKLGHGSLMSALEGKAGDLEAAFGALSAERVLTKAVSKIAAEVPVDVLMGLVEGKSGSAIVEGAFLKVAGSLLGTTMVSHRGSTLAQIIPGLAKMAPGLALLGEDAAAMGVFLAMVKASAVATGAFADSVRFDQARGKVVDDPVIQFRAELIAEAHEAALRELASSATISGGDFKENMETIWHLAYSYGAIDDQIDEALETIAADLMDTTPTTETDRYEYQRAADDFEAVHSADQQLR